MKAILFFTASLVTSMSFADPQIVTSFKDGSTVKCAASYSVGYNGENFQSVALDIFYRIDDPRHKDAIAYFKTVPKLEHYSFDGLCSNTNCQLSIRDTKTNIVSTVNAGFAVVNKNTVQNQVSDYGITPSTAATFECKKISPSRYPKPM